MKNLVLVLTNSCDIVADKVIQLMRDRGGSVARFDPADMPLRSTLTMQLGAKTVPPYLFRDYGPGIELDQVKSVWYRRPSTFILPRYSTEHAARFAASELAMALGGALRSLYCFWMNSPGAIVEAGYKVDQLVRADKVGLLVPDTCVTSQPAHARRFVREHNGKVIIKVMGDPDIYAPGEGPAVIGNIYTSRLRVDEPVPYERVQDAPVLLQEEIPKQADIRIIVIGDIVHAVAIDSQQDEQTVVDWRRGGPGLAHEVIDLPEQLRSQLLSLTGSYHLSFAAIDMVLDTSGQYIFLEINPSGEWGWLERVTDLDISSSVATILMSGGPSATPDHEPVSQASGARLPL